MDGWEAGEEDGFPPARRSVARSDRNPAAVGQNVGSDDAQVEVEQHQEIPVYEDTNVFDDRLMHGGQPGNGSRHVARGSRHASFTRPTGPGAISETRLAVCAGLLIEWRAR